MSATEAELMARPKGRPKAANPPAPQGPRATIVNLKGSEELAEWLELMHRETYIAKSTIVRLGLSAWARENGKPAPPEI